MMSLKGKVVDMASEKEANLARTQYSDFLRELGAHSIGVDERKRQEEPGFAVIAFFDKRPSKTVPQTLKVRSGKQTIAVPLEVEIMKMPSPE
ncbi:MAG: hypothetical protein QOH25_2282 [Acidobacteriota bacterium]|jgi:hypothetical protein|nr:hypothetical protein [Acidobacteriota bacterium]